MLCCFTSAKTSTRELLCRDAWIDPRNFNPRRRHRAMPAVNLVAEERTIKGSYVGTCVPVRDLPRYIDLFRGGRLPVDRLLSGTLALDDINRGFDLLHEGKAVRQVVLL